MSHMIEIFALNGLISATNYSNKTLTLKPSSPPLLPQKSIFFPHYFLIPHKMLWRLLESHKDRLSISLQILNKFKRVNFYFPLKLSENCKFGRIEVNDLNSLIINLKFGGDPSGHILPHCKVIWNFFGFLYFF